MKNQINSFWAKFARYLLIGLSTMVLIAGGQQMMVSNSFHRGPDTVLAEADNCEEQTCPEPGYNPGQPPDISPPYNPPVAPACPVASSQPECLVFDGDGQYHHFWVTRYANDCKPIEKEGPNELCGS